MSQLFTWGGQSIGVSASASVLPMNTQDWPPLGWTGWNSLQSKGLSRVFSNTTIQKDQFFGSQLSLQILSTCYIILLYELLDVQAGFRKGRGTRDQIANICWIIRKEREFQKNIYFCFIDYSKAFDCVDHNKVWKILKEMWIPDRLTCLFRNLYAGQEATVRTGNGTTDWF